MTNLLFRTLADQPANEPMIRGMKMAKKKPENVERKPEVAYLPREKLVLLRAIRTEEEIQDGIRRGVLVVID